LAALTLFAAAPASAQVALRPFVQFADEKYSATTSFNAVLGSNVLPAWGGGVDLVLHRRFFVDLAISRMAKSGQRAFLSNGEVFHLGIPVRVTSTPIEITAGYKFRLKKTRVFPYVGAGVGSYSYKETSDFSAAGDDVDVRHAGFVADGGVEVRVSRWVGISGDAHYTHVPGILGQGGISKDAGENDFGGVAGRVRVILGR
jgi:outer membrane protein W